MRGRVIKRKGSKRWTIVLDIGRDQSTGKRQQQWLSVPGTKKDAEKKLAELMHQLDTGAFVRPGKTTLTDFLTKWLTDYRPHISPRGFERYEGIIKSHIIPALGNVKLTQLRPEQIQRYYTNEGQKLSARTVRYHHAVLHVALKTAVKWGLLTRNPADAVTPPRGQRTIMPTWDDGEVNQFLETAKTSSYYELFYLALFTGMRRSELLGLRWRDLDLDLGQVSVSQSLHRLKNGSFIVSEPKTAAGRRTIALTPSTTLTFKEYYAKQKLHWSLFGIALLPDDLVFRRADNKPLRPNTITRAWEVTAARAGVRVIRLHDARHTHASLMLKAHVPPKIVQERLGHAGIQITLDTYSHVTPGLQEAAAERFDEIVLHKVSADKK